MMRRLDTWIISWATLLDGIIGVFSLGLWTPLVAYHAMTFFIDVQAERRLSKEARIDK